MNEQVDRIQRHLYRRRYETSNGDSTTLYYAAFKDWKGKRRKFYLGSELKTAREELTVLESRNIRKEDFDQEKTSGLTFFAWVERFFQVKASKRSLDKDQVSCNRLKAFFGDVALDSITTSQIEAYKQKRLTERTRYGKGPAPATINRELACLRTMLILAARDGIIDRVPYVELFEEKNQRTRVADEKEFQAILEGSPLHLKEILACIWDTGMRKREALDLTWDKIDFKNRVIRLLGSDTKTGEGRVIPISPRVLSILQAIRQREKVGKVVTLTDRVFLFRGRAIDRFDRAYQTACKKAGVEGLWIHDLRATFATRKIAEGFDRDWVKMITGHKTDHVFRRYNRPSLDNLRAVVANDSPRVPPQGNRENTQLAN